MKDKTHSMNMGLSAEDAARGYGDAGVPESTDAGHQRRMRQGGLSGNQALTEYENPNGDGGGRVQPGGFLRRNNYSERN